MPFQTLLEQVAAEHAALQTKYDEAVAENLTLNARLTNCQAADSAVRVSWQREFSVEPLFRAPPDDVPHGDEHFVKQSPLPDGTSESLPQFLPKTKMSVTTDSSINGSSDFLKIRSGSWRKSHGGTPRERVKMFLLDPCIEVLIGLIVITNVIFMWADVDIRANQIAEPTWLKVVGVLYLLFYLCEFCARSFAYGKRVFDDHWNKLDFAIIVVDLTMLFTSTILGAALLGGMNVQIFRLLRIFRLARILKVLRFAPEVQLLIHGFQGAAKALIYATLFLWIVIVLWAFIYVEAIGPLIRQMTLAGSFDSCPRCQKAYSSIFEAQITLIQQTIAGDSWGLVTLQVIEEYPLSTPIFIASLITVQLGLMNLILTVIVDAAGRAKEENLENTIFEKEKAYSKMEKDLVKMCQALDADNDGELTIEELLEGMRTHKGFMDTMALMDVTEQDLALVFKFLDEDQSGTVSYAELVNNLYRTKQHNVENTLFFLRGYMTEMRHKMKTDFRTMLIEEQRIEDMLERQIEETLSIKDSLASVVKTHMGSSSHSNGQAQTFVPAELEQTLLTAIGNVLRGVNELKSLTQSHTWEREQHMGGLVGLCRSPVRLTPETTCK